MLDTIDLVNIDEKLKALWDEELGKNRVRASFYTLLLYTQKGNKEQHYKKFLQTVIAKLPSRVLWIKEEKEQNVGSSGYIRTQVHTESVSAGTFCEIIEISVAGKYVERVPSIVLPHLLPDLPIYLLWTEVPSEKSIFSKIAPWARRVIFDIAPITDLKSYASGIYSYVLQKKPLGDLCWATLKKWRHLFILTFSNPEALSHLQEGKSIYIAYYQTEDKEHSQTAAILLQGWIAANMQWEFISVEREGEAHRIIYKSATKKVALYLIPRPSDIPNLPPGAILSIEIESHKDNAEYLFKRTANAKQVSIQYSDQYHCDLPFYHNLPGASEGQEIVEEIFYPSEYKHFKKTLEYILKL